jgi:hypothetical protein
MKTVEKTMKTTLKIIGVIAFIAVASIAIGLWGARDTTGPVVVSQPPTIHVVAKTSAPVSKPAPTAQQGIKLETHINNVQFDNSK